MPSSGTMVQSCTNHLYTLRYSLSWCRKQLVHRHAHLFSLKSSMGNWSYKQIMLCLFVGAAHNKQTNREYTARNNLHCRTKNQVGAGTSQYTLISGSVAVMTSEMQSALNMWSASGRVMRERDGAVCRWVHSLSAWPTAHKFRNAPQTTCSKPREENVYE
jgi:hypothetical protein